MWCRTILTAVAISYVICMLLLSGLQKDDLDVGTLEKLKRHNVTIDDKNNESLRQECLLNSYPDRKNDTQKYETTEAQNVSLETSTTNKSIEVVDYPKLRPWVLENLLDKIVLQNKTENIKTESSIMPLQILNVTLKTNDGIHNLDNLGNITKIEENNGLKIEYKLENQPDFQRVVNFWSKLTHISKKTVVTKLPTTPLVPNVNEEKNVTVRIETSNNNGYVHSREMEFISRILTEYLASQTAPSTTLKTSTRKALKDLILSENEEILKKPLMDEKPDSIFPSKIIEQPLDTNLSKANNYSRVQPHKHNDNYMKARRDESEGALVWVPLTDKIDDQKKIKRTHDNPGFGTRALELKPVEKHNPTLLQDNFLHTNNDLHPPSVPLLFIETATKSIKLRKIEQEKSESLDQNIFQYRKDNSNNKNLDRNENVMTNDQIKTSRIESKSWEPIRNYKIRQRNKLKFAAMEKKESDQKQIVPNKESMGTNSELTDSNSGTYNQFKLNVNNSKQLQKVSENEFDVIKSDIKQSEPIQNFNKKYKLLNVIPPDLKNTQPNKNNNMEDDTFKHLLPSMKKSKLNQNSINIPTKPYDDNQLKHKESNELEQFQNVDMYGNQLSPVRGSTNKPENKEPPKINKDQFNAEPTITSYLEQITKGFNDNHHNKMPAMIKKYEQIQQDSKNQLKNIQTNYNSERNQNVVMDDNQFQNLPSNLKNLKQNESFGMSINEPQRIPANIIKEIAEEVKQIVLKGIVKEETTSTVNSSPSTTTTAVPSTITSLQTTITTTDKATTHQKEFTETHYVMQKLMEFFNDYKAMKETAKLSTQALQNYTILNYETTKAPKMPFIQLYPPVMSAYNPFIMKTAPVNNKPIEVNSYGLEMASAPITSGIVPMPFNSGADLPQTEASQYVPQLKIQQRGEVHSPAIMIQTNSDEIAPLPIQISHPLKLINQHIIVPTKEPANKLKEEHEHDSMHEKKIRGPPEFINQRENLQLNTDFNKNKERFADTPKKSEYNNRYPYQTRFNRDREKIWYRHSDTENDNSHPPRSSSYHDTSNYPGSYSHSENLSRPKGLSHYGGLSHSRGYNNAGSPKDIIRHHPGSYGYSDHERQYPRYESKNFHEKLERIENWPRNNWKNIRAMTDENCCDEISARQQLPLTKVKQRSRFDDTHFTNFLKSQQKVTDMLEKILANSNKANDVEVSLF